MEGKGLSKYWTVKELAEVLGICRGRAYELCTQEGFPALRISPHRIVIPKEAFEEWAMAHLGKEMI